MRLSLHLATYPNALLGFVASCRAPGAGDRGSPGSPTRSAGWSATSPDDPPSTIKQWSRTDPVDFVTTAVSQLDGTSGTATYGPPYNNASSGQHIAFIRVQKWLGVSHPSIPLRTSSSPP